MNVTISIQSLKRQLNIEETFLDDDIILQHFLDVSILSAQNYLGTNSLTGYTGTTGVTAVPISINQAIILLAAHFYINRTMVAFTQAAIEIPYSFQFLLNPYKDFVIA